MPGTSVAHNRLLFLLRPFTVLMKQTRQVVFTVKQSIFLRCLWEQHALKNVNNCLNTNIYRYLETSGGQSSNLNLNVVHFFNTSVN